MDKELELAQILQNSNVPEVSALAKAYLELSSQYEILQDRLISMAADEVLVKHEKLFKRLAENGD